MNYKDRRDYFATANLDLETSKLGESFQKPEILAQSFLDDLYTVFCHLITA